VLTLHAKVSQSRTKTLKPLGSSRAFEPKTAQSASKTPKIKIMPFVIRLSYIIECLEKVCQGILLPKFSTFLKSQMFHVEQRENAA
jgi:hypothetical protein